MSRPNAEVRVQALRLLHPVLCEPLPIRRGETEQHWLARTLIHCGDISEMHSAEAIVAQVFRREPDPLRGLLELAPRLVSFPDGEPRCRDHHLWHHIGFELDTDLIIAARLATLAPLDDVDEAKDRLSWPGVLAEDGLVTDQMGSQVLVDTHVHLGGSLPGSFYWIALMANFAPVYRLERWDFDPKRWPKRIDRALHLRRELAASLLDIDYRIHVPDLWTAPAELVEPFADYVLVALFPDPHDRFMRNPILGERYLLWRLLSAYALRKIDKKQSELLLEYLRIRNSFCRELALQMGYPGLYRFTNSYDRQSLIWNPRPPKRGSAKQRRLNRASFMLERFRVRHALRYQFSDPTDAPWARDHGHGLEPPTSSHAEDLHQDNASLSFESATQTPWRPARQVELRVSPVLGKTQMRTIYAYLMGLDDFVRYERDAPLLRMGLVFHLTKMTDHRQLQEQGRWTRDGLISVLDTIPALRPFIVGLDAAGRERCAPPRGFRSFFLPRQRRSPSEALLVCEDRDDRREAQSFRRHFQAGKAPMRLRRTYHAGEDFPDLLTGLRWMDDAVNLLELQPGDRIGHGLALAWTPQTWYDRHPVVVKTHREHLVDLAWCHYLADLHLPKIELQPDFQLKQLALNLWEHWLVQNKLKQIGDRLQFERTASDYADSQSFPNEDDLIDALIDGRPQCLPQPHPDEADWWRDDSVEVPITSDYLQLVSACQRRVRTRLARRDIVLEVCPTSNMLISGLRAYKDLPYLALNQTGTRHEYEVVEPIMFSVNSDNPGYFKTTIAHEFRILARAFKDHGLSNSEVTRWLDEARRVGLNSTFIPRWSPPTKLELRNAILRIGDPEA